MANLLLHKDGKLAKLTIRGFAEPTRSIPIPGAVFTAMFNPTQYSKKYNNRYTQTERANNARGSLKYQSTQSEVFSFDFLIDGTGASGEKVEVSEKIKEFLYVAYDYSELIKRPYYLKLFWGDEIASCVLDSVDINYTMFRPNGSPLRATIKATFREDPGDDLIKQITDNVSVGLHTIKKIKEGDTLLALTHSVYGDVSRLSDIADTNELDNLRSLPKGSDILFPSFN